MGIKKLLNIVLASIITVTVMLSAFPLNVAASTGTINKNQSIAAGRSHFLAVRADSSLWAWGSNTYGQLGNGTTESRETPVKVMDDVAAVAAGSNHTLILKKDGSLWVCGENDSGQLGINTSDNKNPIPVKLMDDVAAISAGQEHSIAVKKDGSLWAWGSNTFGQIGDNTEEDRATPVKVMDGVAMVAAGQYNTFAILADGTLWGWGETHLSQDFYGAYGNAYYEVYHQPTKIMDDVKAVTAGFRQILVVTRSGSLWAWGENSDGVLCDGGGQILDEDGESFETIWIGEPFKVMDGVLSVAANDSLSLVLKTDGNLYAWGYSFYAEKTFMNDKLLDDVAIMATTGDTTIAVKNDGSLWSWGIGYLGDGNYYYNDEYQEKPIKVMDDVRLYGRYLGDPAPGSKYIYDSNKNNNLLSKPQADITTIIDEQSAVDIFSALLSEMTGDQKEDGEALDDLALFWEAALTAGTQKAVTGQTILIDVDSLKEMLSVSETVAAQFNDNANGQNIELLRDTRTNLLLTSDVRSAVTITADSGISSLDFDNVKVAAPFAAISMNKDSLTGGEGIELRNLKITIVEPGFNILRLWGIAAVLLLVVLFVVPGIRKKLPKWLLPSVGFVVILANTATYILIVPQPYEKETGAEGVEVILRDVEQATLSLPVNDGADPEFLVIFNEDGQPSGKYNVLTNTVDTKINESGVYIVKDNRVSFADIETKSALMQEAIEQLASRGLMPGLREDLFAPDDLITRAEYVAVIIKTLSLLDATIETTFADVKKSDWFYSAAASAQSNKIINGFPDNTFRGNIELPKDQMVVGAANTLTSQMKYKTPKNTADILARYSDLEELAAWAWDGVAIATQAGIMIYREDAKFNSADAMTRGDAAIILYRMFKKIW